MTYERDPAWAIAAMLEKLNDNDKHTFDELIKSARGLAVATREQEMISQVREACGLFSGAMPISPAEAWREALNCIVRLAAVVQTLNHGDR